MKEYLLNSGHLNIVVIPDRKQYFLLDDGPRSMEVLTGFLAGETVDYGLLQPHWFKYSLTDTWSGFDGKQHVIDEALPEQNLIDYFVLKKFNFGSLVAVRDTEKKKVQLFKKDKLAPEAV